MTRQGSIAYYLSSWICGTLFMALCMAGTQSQAHFALSMIRDFLFFYFLALMFGAVPALLFSFLLRRFARWLKFQSLWHWLLGGAILAPLLIGALGGIVLLGGRAAHALLPIYLYVLYAPGLIVQQGTGSIWRMALAGIAAAWVLFRVHRAFAPPNFAEQSSADAQPGPAQPNA